MIVIVDVFFFSTKGKFDSSNLFCFAFGYSAMLCIQSDSEVENNATGNLLSTFTLSGTSILSNNPSL